MYLPGGWDPCAPIPHTAAAAPPPGALQSLAAAQAQEAGWDWLPHTQALHNTHAENTQQSQHYVTMAKTSKTVLSHFFYHPCNS